VLQDVHWSVGYFGYFPSYMLGNLYASQMMVKIRQDLTDLDARIESGDVAALVAWLRENVHQYGAVYRPDDLIQRLTGETLNAEHFVRYIETKFGEIYQLT